MYNALLLAAAAAYRTNLSREDFRMSIRVQQMWGRVNVQGKFCLICPLHLFFNMPENEMWLTKLRRRMTIERYMHSPPIRLSNRPFYRLRLDYPIDTTQKTQHDTTQHKNDTTRHNIVSFCVVLCRFVLSGYIFFNFLKKKNWKKIYKTQFFS